MEVLDIINDSGILDYKDRLGINFDEYPNPIHMFLDTVPGTVGKHNAWKYDQHELLFWDSLKNKEKINRFFSDEKKYRSFFSLLWLYSETVATVTAMCADKRKVKKALRYGQIRKDINFSENNVINITHEQTIELYTVLSTRELAKTVIYFSDIKLIALSNWSCFSLIFLDGKNIESIKEIATVNGLFLRKTEDVITE